jgi:hypothetical protein
MLVDSSFCKRKKIVDRVLKFQNIKKSSDYNKSIYSNLALKLPTFLKKTNLNHIYIDSNKIYGNSSNSNTLSGSYSLHDICKSLDKFSQTNIAKPLIVHFRPSVSFWLFTNCNPLSLVPLQYRLSLIQRKTPVIALIEGPQALDNLGAIMMCPIRIMMTPSIISSYFSDIDTGSMGWGWKTIDVLHNTQYIIKNVESFFKKFTKLPPKFYNDLQHKIINLKPEDSIKYNLVNQVIHFKKSKKLTLKNIEKYYNLEELTSNY